MRELCLWAVALLLGFAVWECGSYLGRRIYREELYRTGDRRASLLAAVVVCFVACGVAMWALLVPTLLLLRIKWPS